MPTTEQIIEALRPVEDPELRRSIVELGMVRDVDLRGDGTVGVLVALTVAGLPAAPGDRAPRHLGACARSRA